MILVPSHAVGDRLIYVRHYRAGIEGDESRICKRCMSSVDPRSYYDFGRRKPEECTCTVCYNQPPSLKSAASEIMFRLIFNIKKFRFDRDMTYDQYIYVAQHNVPIERLVPFNEFLKILKMQYVEFYDSSLGRIHRHCVDVVDSEMSEISMERKISSADEFFRLVTRYKSKFWCTHCSKAVFPIPEPVLCQMLIVG